MNVYIKLNYVILLYQITMFKKIIKVTGTNSYDSCSIITYNTRWNELFCILLINSYSSLEDLYITKWKIHNKSFPFKWFNEGLQKISNTLTSLRVVYSWCNIQMIRMNQTQMFHLQGHSLITLIMLLKIL